MQEIVVYSHAVHETAEDIARSPVLAAGAPMQSAAIFKKGDILFKEEALDNLRFYAAEDCKQERILPCKLYCRHCGSPIADEGRNMLMVSSSLLAILR